MSHSKIQGIFSNWVLPTGWWVYECTKTLTKQQGFWVFVGVSGVGVVIYNVLPREAIFSKVVDWCSGAVRPDYRVTFKRCAVDQATKHTVSPHSHLQAATDRCKGNMLMKVFAVMTGSKLYSLSMSNAERTNTTGDRYVHHAKDIQMLSLVNFPTSNDLVQLTDVDYYIEMPFVMRGNNIVLNTFVPNNVAGEVTDGVFRVLKDDRVEVMINGGGSYSHKLWDYETDHIMVDHWWGSCLYLVEQRDMGFNKRVIFLNCVRIVYGPIGWFIPGHRLKRKRMVYDDLVVLSRSVGEADKVKTMYSIAQVGATCSVLVSESSIRTAMMRCAHSKSPSLADVERILRANNELDPVAAAPYVFALGANKYFDFNCSRVTPSTRDPMIYQTLGPLVHEDGKAGTRELMPYFIKGGFSPARSFNNDNACVDHRIKRVANKIQAYPPMFWVTLDEFVTRIVPDSIAGSLSPENYEYMLTKFKRPSQRGWMESVKHVMYLDSPWVVRAFQKIEFYGKVTAPRNISTLPTDHNVRLGQFSYVFVEQCMKRLDWYAFSKTPKELEDRIMELALASDKIIPTDISKCDGSRGYIHYCLDQALMMRAFGKSYHSEIMRLLSKEAHAKGVTSNDLKYTCDFNTLSGSSKTSWGNTVTNAFNNYLALRHVYDEQGAWDRLGLYGGDDGLAIGIQAEALETTFAKVGMLLKAEVIEQGRSVPFLGRIYLDPWSMPDSIIDVRRQFQRIHATTSPVFVPDNVVLWRKVEGYLVNDARTPLIKDFIYLISKLVPHPGDSAMSKYKDMTNNEVNWWSKRDTTFSGLWNDDLAEKIVAEQFDMTVGEMQSFGEKIRACKTFDDILEFQLKPEIKVEITADVGGEIIEGVAKDHQQQVTTNAKRPQRIPKVKPPKVNNICRFIKKGDKCPYGKQCKFPHQ